MTQTNETQLTLDGIFRLISTGQFGPAEEYCRSYLEQAPDDINVLGLLGAILLKLERPEDAQPVLEKTIRLEPEFAKPHEDLGFLHLRSGDPAQAIQCFEEAIRLDAEQPGAWSGLADALMHHGDRERAQIARRRFQELSPSGRTISEASRCWDAGDTARAEELCEEVLKTEPGNTDALRLLASIAIKDERFVIAEGLLKRLVRLAPNHYLAHNELGRFFGDRGRIPEAIEELRLAVELGPDVANNQRVLGDLLSTVGNNGEALAAYDEALRLEPANATVIAARGHTLRILGRSAEAIEAYEQCTTQNPEIGDAWWNLATMRGYTFSEDQLTAMRQQLDEEGGNDDTRIHAAFALARAAEQQNNYDEAWTWYDRGNSLKRAQVQYDPVTTEMTHNAMIQACDPELLERSKGADFSEPGPIFILGLPRSGSTLVEQILASHSMVEGAGELPYIVMLSSNLGGQDTSGYPEVLADMTAEQLHAVGESYLYHTRSHREGTLPFFTDKMPTNFAHVGLIHMALPHARIINARRHPLDTCIANYRQLYAQGKNMAYDLYELAEYYLEYDRVMAHWDSVLPGRVLRVFYEDVVADLEGQTRRLLDYCGLPWEDACLDFHRNERPVNTASSEQVRQPIYADSVGYWKHYESQLAEIQEILAPVIDE
ncbi:MAG: tetratricopeptide repeat protein [Gammaproteobacteria bacterium]|jgi:tetratricopeptide (TPR) repeat protein|nr:tetratricopeptide repeat protein [Gammaproteobacteria bacterium]